MYLERNSRGQVRRVVVQERGFGRVHRTCAPELLDWCVSKYGPSVRRFAARTGLPLNTLKAALKPKGKKGHRPMHLNELDPAMQRLDSSWKSSVVQDGDFERIYRYIAGSPTGELLRPFISAEMHDKLTSIPVVDSHGLA